MLNSRIPIQFYGEKFIDLVHPWDIEQINDIGYFTEVIIKGKQFLTREPVESLKHLHMCSLVGDEVMN